MFVVCYFFVCQIKSVSSFLGVLFVVANVCMLCFSLFC